MSVSSKTASYGELLPKPHDNREFRTYLNELALRLGDVQIVSYDTLQEVKRLAIDLLYVPQRVSPHYTSANTDIKDWPKGELLFDALTEHSRVVVLGDPGGGKSTLLNWVGWRLSVGLSRALPGVLDWLLPIPLILREIPLGDGQSFDVLLECFLNHPLGGPLVQSASLREYWARGQVLLLIDGLDEISVADRHKLRRMLFNGLGRGNAYRALVTSRMVGYEECPLHEVSWHRETPELESPRQRGQGDQAVADIAPGADGYLGLLTLRESDKVRWGVQRWLMPFRDEQIHEFATRWYGLRLRSSLEASERASRLNEQIRRSDDTLRLARTPHLLTMMAIVVDSRLQLPDGRALLYREIASAYLGAADKTRNIPVIEIPWAEKQRWLGYVAFRMQLERDAAEEIRRRADPGSDEEEYALLAPEPRVLEWLREAMGKSSYARDAELPQLFLGWVARRSGLLLPRGIRDSQSHGEIEHYGFVHLSFQEYFCAAYLLTVVTGPRFQTAKQRGKRSAKMSVPPTRDDLASRGGTRHWHETIVHLFELCADERGGEWADAIREAIFPQVTKKARKEDGDALYLLARLAVNRHAGFSSDAQQAVMVRVVNHCLQVSNEPGPSVDKDTRAVVPLLQSSIHGRALIARLKQVPELVLNLSDTALTELGALSSLTSLQWLDLSGTGVSDVSALSGLKSLLRLELSRTGVSDVSALSGLKSLLILALEFTGVSDVSTLSGLKSLQSLTLRGTAVSDVSALSGLKSLEGLYLSGTSVSDVSTLSGLKSLKTLSLTGAAVNDVSSLSGLKSLEWLSLSHTEVSDLSALCGLKSLEWLSVSRTGVTDVSVLSGSKSLRRLDLSGTGVSDVSALSELRSLKWLDLSGTGVSDVSALSGLRLLKWLNLRGTGVSDLSALKGITGLEIIR